MPNRRTLTALVIAVLLVSITVLPAFAWLHPLRIDNYGDSQDQTTSMLTGPTGGTFLAFARRGSDELFWLKRRADGWKRTRVLGQGSTQCYDGDNTAIGPSAAFAPDGSPRIASACIAVGGGAKFLYTGRTGGVWETEFVGYGPSRTGNDSSATSMTLTMSPTGKAWIVFADFGTKDVSRYRQVRGGWKLQQLVRGVDVCCGNQGKYVDAATDPVTGLLGVAWTNRVDTEAVLVYAEFNARGKIVGSAETVPFGGLQTFGKPSLAYRANGDPAIAVQQSDGVSTSPAFALRTGGVWAVHPVDPSITNGGLHPALDVTGDVFRVAYPDDASGDLRYASSTDGISWTAVTPVSRGDVGDTPSLAVNAAGRVTIAYYNTSRTGLWSVTGP